MKPTTLASLLYRVGRKHRNPERALRRTALGLVGKLDPCGDSNSKTDSVSTYRKVGATCPSSCRYLGNGCQAQTGNVNTHQNRASAEVKVALLTTAFAFVWSALTGGLTRLHVSGDFGQQVDATLWEYVNGLCSIADTVNRLRGMPRGTPIAWTYTHMPNSTPDTDWIVKLREHGILVRLSDKGGRMGALVWQHNNWRALKETYPNSTLVPCLAQKRKDETCFSCRWCWEKPEWTIVFEPEGSRKKKVIEVINQEIEA